MYYLFGDNVNISLICNVNISLIDSKADTEWERFIVKKVGPEEAFRYIIYTLIKKLLYFSKAEKEMTTNK